MSVTNCEHCGLPVPGGSNACVHCAWPGLFPNVRAARDDQPELERRYQAARADAAARGCEAVVSALEESVRSSKAVLARGSADVERLAASERNLYSTYYQQLEGASRVPDGDDVEPPA